MGERWEWVPGHRGHYMVTDAGRVFSFIDGDRRGNFRRPEPLEMPGSYTPGGYRRVVLTGEGTKRTVKVAALVLEAFAGPRPDGMTVAHENGNPGDDRLANLSWKTQAENNRDKVWHGTSGKGEANPSAVVTRADVREMRRRAWAGESYAAVARDYPITDRAVSAAVRGKTWAHTLDADRLALAKALAEVMR